MRLERADVLGGPNVKGTPMVLDKAPSCHPTGVAVGHVLTPGPRYDVAVDTPSTAPGGERTQAPLSRWHRWGRLSVGLATVIGTVIAALTLWLSWRGADADSPITIDPPEHMKISTCAALHGSAPVKDGYVLWIGHSKGRDYVFYLATREEGTRWRANPRIGSSKDAGKDFNVYAFYLDERHSRWLEGARATDKDGNRMGVHFDGMPPDAQDMVTRTVVHDDSPDAAGC